MKFETFSVYLCFFFEFAEEYEAQDQCICWCQGWAEVHIRRPTGTSI